MNQDETNLPLSSDLPPIAPELETRLSAWIAGEMSTEERAEFERQVASDPQLAEYRQRMEAVRDLMTEALRAEPEPLRLSAERRARLLSVLGNDSAALPLREKVVVLAPKPAWWQGRYRQIYFGAAGIALGSAAALIFVARQTPMYEKQAELQFAKREPSVMQVQSVVDASIRSSDNADLIGIKRADDERFSKAREVAVKASADLPDYNRALAKAASGAGGLERMEPVAAPATPRPVWSGSKAVDLAARDLATNDEQAIRFRSALAESATTTPAATETIAITPPADRFKSVFDSRITTGGSILPSGGTLLAANAATAVPPMVVTVPGLTTENLSSIRGYTGKSDVQFGPASKPVETDTFQSLTLGASTVSGSIAVASVDSEREMKLKDLDVAKPNGAGGSARASRFGSAVDAGSVTLGSDKKEAVASNEVLTLSAFEVRSPQRVSVGRSGSRQVAATAKKKPVAQAPAAKALDGDKPKADLPAKRPAPPPPPRNETSATTEPFSTFSLHVSDVSFRLAHAALLRGEMPDASRIRPEEFYNAFSYGDPVPTAAEKVGARIEQAAHPFLQQRNLVRIAMRVPATGRGAGTPLRLTVMLDTSGSMEREDRVASVRRAMAVLVSLLGPADRITLIGFARQPRLLAEAVPGDQAKQVLDIIARIPAEGGTNLEEALKLAGELARRHHLAGAQNRIVVLTDGAANLGNADPDGLATAIATLRQQGIAFDACGVGLDGLDDAVLEALTRNGDGRYYALNSPEAADEGFARQLAGAFRPAAENVKLQVRFNPARVGHYRLIGFEQHRLRPEDFRNDKVDAAELAAEEAAVAVYQVEVLPQGTGELGEVFVRFRDAATSQMVERSWTITFDPGAPAFGRASPTLQLAGTAALLADKLGGGSAAEAIKLRDLTPVVNGLRGTFAHEPRVQELVTMFNQMRRLGIE